METKKGGIRYPEDESFLTSSKYKWVRQGLVGAGVIGVGAALIWGGTPSPEEQWASSPGTRGFINLDDVKDAFMESDRIADFERKLNEIYGGDNLLLLDIRKTHTGLLGIEAVEDLNKNNKRDPRDDLIFTLTADQKAKKATLMGRGANGFYEESWEYNPPEPQDEFEKERYAGDYYQDHPHIYFPHFYYWGLPYHHYYSSPSRLGSIDRHRTSYRGEPGFQRQIMRNDSYADRMKTKHGSKFNRSIQNISGTRKSYMTQNLRSSSFRSGLSSGKGRAGWGVRSNMASLGSYKPSSSFGGFRGFSGIGGFSV